MTLRLGKMTSRELAEWMGLAYNTYRNSRKKRLEALKFYCEFEEVYNGVIIKEIFVPDYIKDLSEDDRIYVREILQCGDGLSTISGIVRKLTAFDSRFQDISPRTLEYRMRKAGIRTFGETKEETSRGLCGSRKYVWAIKINNYNHYRFMTKEEEALFKKINNEYYNKPETQEKLQKDELMKERLRKKEISEQEFLIWTKEDKDYFNKVILPFKQKIGHIVTSATQHEVIQSQIDLLLDDSAFEE